jgi:hypothetical protein
MRNGMRNGATISRRKLKHAGELARDKAMQDQVVELARQASALVRAARRDARSHDTAWRSLRREALEFVRRLDRTARVVEPRPTHRRRNAALVLLLALGGGVAAAGVATRTGP